MHAHHSVRAPQHSFLRAALPAIAGYVIGRAAATPSYHYAYGPSLGGGWGPQPGYGYGGGYSGYPPPAYGGGWGSSYGNGYGHGYGYDRPRRSPGHSVLHAAATIGGWYAGKTAGTRVQHGPAGTAIDDSRFGAWFAGNTGAAASNLLRPIGGLAGALLGHLFTR